MKWLFSLLLFIAPVSALGADCAEEVRSTYIAVQSLYEEPLEPEGQLQLHEILQSLCQSESTNSTRYSTKGLSRDKRRYQSEGPENVWVGIDWYRGFPEGIPEVPAEIKPPE